MPRPARPPPVPTDLIQQRIRVAREKRVLLDADLARFYGVTTFNLNKAVARNPDRFPEDFAFHLTPDEAENLIFQSGISSDQPASPQKLQEKDRRHGGARKPPRVFTEQGVAIVRAFVQLRELLAGHRQLAGKLAELENRLEGHDEAIRNLFEAIRQLITPDAPAHGRRMGFRQTTDE